MGEEDRLGDGASLIVTEDDETIMLIPILIAALIEVVHRACDTVKVIAKQDTIMLGEDGNILKVHNSTTKVKAEVCMIEHKVDSSNASHLLHR